MLKTNLVAFKATTDIQRKLEFIKAIKGWKTSKALRRCLNLCYAYQMEMKEKGCVNMTKSFQLKVRK